MDSEGKDTRGEKENTIFQEKRKLKGTGALNNRGVLLVLSENLFGKSYVINESMTIIGRRSKCDISINDPMVSKVHCVITTDGEGNFFIEDLDSTNSTFLNKKEVKKKAPLLYGDRVVIGNTVFRFYLEEKLLKR